MPPNRPLNRSVSGSTNTPPGVSSPSDGLSACTRPDGERSCASRATSGRQRSVVGFPPPWRPAFENVHIVERAVRVVAEQAAAAAADGVIADAIKVGPDGSHLLTVHARIVPLELLNAKSFIPLSRASGWSIVRCIFIAPTWAPAPSADSTRRGRRPMARQPLRLPGRSVSCVGRPYGAMRRASLPNQSSTPPAATNEVSPVATTTMWSPSMSE